MFRLIYVSSAVRHFSKDELLSLLKTAREKNSLLGITGLLLYKDGDFLQVLEGDEAAVRTLLDTIQKDQRHRGTIIMAEEKAESRLFGEWSMGFRDLADPQLQSMPGFSPFMNRSLKAASIQNDPGGVMEMIAFFAENR